MRCARDAGKDLRLSYNYNRVVFIKPFNYTDHRFLFFSRYIHQRVKLHLEMVVSFSSKLRFQNFSRKSFLMSRFAMIFAFVLPYSLHLELGAAVQLL